MAWRCSRSVAGIPCNAYQAVAPALDERVRRLVPGAEALAAGSGGQAAVARATGAAPGTIRRGIRELREPTGRAPQGRVRRAGGGRKRTVERDPGLRAGLDRLVEPLSRRRPTDRRTGVLKDAKYASYPVPSSTRSISLGSGRESADIPPGDPSGASQTVVVWWPVGWPSRPIGEIVSLRRQR